MTPVNITIQIEETAKRRSSHGSVLFGAMTQATEADAIAALERNGFDRSTVRDGWRRTLYQVTAHFGGKHFEFFISDEPIPPDPPSQEELA